MYTYIYIYTHTLFACFLKSEKTNKKILRKPKNWLPMGKEQTRVGIKARFSKYTLFYSLTLEIL